jgi:lysophospholipase L1-like esterase
VKTTTRRWRAVVFLVALGVPCAVLPKAQNSTPSSSATEEEKREVPDWAGLRVYEAANTELMKRPAAAGRVIFFGDSITEMWNLDLFFRGKGYINRGIGGQTTAQMLVRFRQDVIQLKPKVVVILAGTNDVAENQGPTTLDAIEGNLASMVELADTHHIRVVVCSVLPVGVYPWRKHIRPVEKISALNAWLKGYADGRGAFFVDYHSAMQNETHAMKKELSEDGVHPNSTGFSLMAPLAARAIAEALEPY